MVVIYLVNIKGFLPVLPERMVVTSAISICEQWKKPGGLGYIGDYTTQLCRDQDYNKALQESLLNSQYNGK